MVTPSRRPSWSRAAATWRCLWVSTPTVTRAGSRCAMVVLPSFLLGRVVAPAGWADNTATSVVATGSYQVTRARSVPLAAAVASGRQVLSQASSRWGQGSGPRQGRTMNRHGGHGRPTGPKPGIPPVAYRVRPHRDHHRDHRSRVLGDVPGHLLSRQLPGLVAVGGDVAYVQLLPPAGIPIRSASLLGRAGHT